MLKHDKCGKFEERISDLEKEVQRLTLLLEEALKKQDTHPTHPESTSIKIEED